MPLRRAWGGAVVGSTPAMLRSCRPTGVLLSVAMTTSPVPPPLADDAAAVPGHAAKTDGDGRRLEAPPSPGPEALSSPAGLEALPSLSPSRAADFKTCPLLFRLRTIDRIPEPPHPDRARGTLVHAVLERLFDLPAAHRTPAAAA